MCFLGAKIQRVPSSLTQSMVTVFTILHYHIILKHYLIIIIHYHIMLTHQHIVLSIILQVVKLSSSCAYCHPSNIWGEKRQMVTVLSSCFLCTQAIFQINYLKRSHILENGFMQFGNQINISKCYYNSNKQMHKSLLILRKYHKTPTPMCFGHVAEIRQFCYVQEMKMLSKYCIQLYAP